MTPPVLAWHNNPDLKASALTRMRRHRAADEIVQGTYGRMNGSFRGCFHGCLTVEALAAERGVPVDELLDTPIGTGYQLHAAGERMWGIPTALGRLIDTMFEAVQPATAGDFAVAVVEAMRVGADLTAVVDRWIVDVLADEQRGMRRLTADGSIQRSAVERVVDLFLRRLAGEEVDGGDWRAAQVYAMEAAKWDLLGAEFAGAAANAAEWATIYARGTASGVADMVDVGMDTHNEDHATWMADRLIHHISAAPI